MDEWGSALLRCRRQVLESHPAIDMEKLGGHIKVAGGKVGEVMGKERDIRGGLRKVVSVPFASADA